MTIFQRLNSKSFYSLVMGLSLSVNSTSAIAQACNVNCADGETCVSAGLYPYVPNTEAFATAICDAWSKAGRSEKLYLIRDGEVWDGGYTSNPQYINANGTTAQIDAIAYDAMYLEYWKTQTIEIPATHISNPGDFVDYAKTALTEPNNAMTALPLLGCTNIMFYRDGDAVMDQVTTLSAFIAANPADTYISPVPFDDTGAMMNLSGSTTDAVNYMMQGYLDTGTWPAIGGTPDPALVQKLTELSESASYYNALTGAIPPLAGTEDQYIRAGYFSAGYARTTVGFSESMSQMSAATKDNLKLRAFPWTDKTNVSTPFYSDVVGVNKNSPYITGANLSFVLADIMTQSAVVQASIAPANGDLSYLFPARKSVLDTLSNSYPLYSQMNDILTEGSPELVVMPTIDRDGFHAFGGTIRDQAKTNFSGGCDLESSTRAFTSSEAAAVCTPLCSNSGGWVSSWTNEVPPGWEGYTACGCNSCIQDSPVPTKLLNPMSVAVEVDHPRHLRYQRN